jgi:hypothetical protein
MKRDIRTRLRDWWRGFTTDDLISLNAKLYTVVPPGSVIELTRAEHAAMLWALKNEVDL